MMNLPLLPYSCQSSVRLEASIDKVFERVARVAITFNKIDINKKYKSLFRKPLASLAGSFARGNCLNKKSALFTPSIKRINEAHDVKGTQYALT